MNSLKVAAIAAIAASLLAPVCAKATVVNLCANDTQTSANPADRNLSQALKMGGSISFACGGLATLRVNGCYTVDRDTDINGGGKVVLDSNHRGCMFFGSDNSPATLRLRSLKVLNAGAPLKLPEPGAVGLGRIGTFIEGRFRAVELNAVSIEHSWAPVRLRAGSLRVLASSFANNDETVLVGGAIEVLDHSRFINNRGLPLFSDDGAVVIENSEFLSNTGSVMVFNPNPRAGIGSLKISHTNFSNNVAIGNGGALHLGVDATIEESEFHNNGARNGGAIYISGNTSAVSLRMVKFGANVAAQYGGAIAFEESDAKLEFSLAHATFEDNRATNGGALSLKRSFHSNLFFKGGAVAFVRNIASDSGGAIFAPNASIQLSRGVFIENRAGADGGAIDAL